MPTTRRITLGLVWSLTAEACLWATDRPVSFTSDIRPVFQNSCWKCHGSAVQLSKLDLRTREAALQGRQRGAAVDPREVEESRLYRLVAGIQSTRRASVCQSPDPS